MKRLTVLLLSLGLIAAACSDAATSTTLGTVATTSPIVTDDAPSSSSGAIAPETVTLSAGDLQLAATLYPAGGRWVVLGHMRPADRTSWDGFARQLQAAGYTVLAYDNRGYGESDGSKEPFELRLDAESAIGFALGQGADAIIYGGASMNGAAAVELAAFYDFAMAFAMSAVPRFESVPNALSYAPDVDEPFLFIAASDDGTAVEDSTRYFDLVGSARLRILPTGGHGTAMFEANPDLGQQIIDWLANPTG